jgi:hypothetical protein
LRACSRQLPTLPPPPLPPSAIRPQSYVNQNYDMLQHMLPSGLTTLSFTKAGVVYVNVFDAFPAPGAALPNVFVLRVGKGNYAELLLNSAVSLAANDLNTGLVTISWPAATAKHALYAPAPAGDGVPPPRCVCDTLSGALLYQRVCGCVDVTVPGSSAPPMLRLSSRAQPSHPVQLRMLPLLMFMPCALWSITRTITTKNPTPSPLTLHALRCLAFCPVAPSP